MHWARALDSQATVGAMENLKSWAEESNQGPDLDNRWWNWVRDYMQRDLTQPSDLYAAFACVTKLHQETTGDEPVIGLWRKHLPMHLAWGLLLRVTLVNRQNVLHCRPLGVRRGHG
jgi:hypothetical protein